MSSARPGVTVISTSRLDRALDEISRLLATNTALRDQLDRANQEWSEHERTREKLAAARRTADLDANDAAAEIDRLTARLVIAEAARDLALTGPVVLEPLDGDGSEQIEPAPVPGWRRRLAGWLGLIAAIALTSVGAFAGGAGVAWIGRLT
jgi:hypothetical protein